MAVYHLSPDTTPTVMRKLWSACAAGAGAGLEQAACTARACDLRTGGTSESNSKALKSKNKCQHNTNSAVHHLK